MLLVLLPTRPRTPQPHHPSTTGTSATALQHPVPWEPLLLDHAAGSDPAGKMSHEFSLADALPEPALPKPLLWVIQNLANLLKAGCVPTLGITQVLHFLCVWTPPSVTPFTLHLGPTPTECLPLCLPRGHLLDPWHPFLLLGHHTPTWGSLSSSNCARPWVNRAITYMDLRLFKNCQRQYGAHTDPNVAGPLGPWGTMYSGLWALRMGGQYPTPNMPHPSPGPYSDSTPPKHQKQQHLFHGALFYQEPGDHQCHILPLQDHVPPQDSIPFSIILSKWLQDFWCHLDAWQCPCKCLIHLTCINIPTGLPWWLRQ